jgi:hypothetical protein
MSTSGWTRYPKNSTAFRGYGAGALVLVKAEIGWRLFDDTKSELSLQTSAEDALDSVIEVVDLLYPPEGWIRLDQTSWERGDWKITSAAAGWKISHPRFSTRQSFRSADRARKWVDLRADRLNSTRGPRCRAETRANRTLPDVRVTEAERAAALKLASDLNLTFAELVRAALKGLINAGASSAIVYDPANHTVSAPRPGCTCVVRDV